MNWQLFQALTTCLALTAFAGALGADPGACRDSDRADIAKYVGQAACVECHGTGGQGSITRGAYAGWSAVQVPFARGPQSDGAGSSPASPCSISPIHAHQRAFLALEAEPALAIARLSGEPFPPTHSRICLSCHSTAADEGRRWTATTFRFRDGVQCEACHGPASLHVESARRADGAGGQPSGEIIKPGEFVECAVCHQPRPSHVEVLERGFRPAPSDGRYKTPVALAISPGGEQLYAVCQQSNALMEIDTQIQSVLRETAVGLRPHAAAISPDGRFAYVTNRMSGTLSFVDLANMAVLREVPVGYEPHGVAVDPATGEVVVVNTGDNSLAILEPSSLDVTRRLMMGGSPWSIAIDGDGRRAYVTNVRPRLGRFREPPVSEITVVDLRTATVVTRPDVSDANMLQGIALTAQGGPALFTLMRTKNLIPTTRTAQGWVITNGLGLLWPEGQVHQVLLDAPAEGFPDVFDVAVSPDGAMAAVLSAGADELAMIDVAKLIATVSAASPQERREVLPNLLGGGAEAIVQRIRVGRNPRAVVFAPDGSSLYVANALDDSISVVDLRRGLVTSTIDLGGPEGVTEIRRGEQLFHSALGTAGRQFSCRSCHPDGHHNGMSFDIEADGLGMHPSDNRTLQGILDTPPFKWEGTNASLHRQCGPRFAAFFTRLAPLPPQDLDALVRYMSTIERPPNRYRDPEGLTLAQRRGKAIFERSTRNDGLQLVPEQRCIRCHSGAYRTNRARNEVATTMWFDAHVSVDLSREMENTDSFGELGSYYFVDAGIRPKFLDNPHLINIADSPPYLHNGAADTLEEIWTRFNMTDRHGATADLTRSQLNDLIAYLKAQ